MALVATRGITDFIYYFRSWLDNVGKLDAEGIERMIIDYTLYHTAAVQMFDICDFSTFEENYNKLAGPDSLAYLVEVVPYNWVYFVDDVLSYKNPDPYTVGWHMGDLTRRLFQWSF
jgi:hypothetical protein